MRIYTTPQIHIRDPEPTISVRFYDTFTTASVDSPGGAEDCCVFFGADASVIADELERWAAAIRTKAAEQLEGGKTP